MKAVRFILAALSALFVLASCEKKEEVLVPEIQFRSNEVSIDSDGGSVTVTYMVSNAVEGEKVSASSDADWLTIDASQVRKLTFSATPNETGQVRNAEVTVTYKGAQNVTLNVSQDFFESPLKISIDAVTATGLTFSVTTSDPNMTWLPMVAYKEGFDTFETADEIFESDIEYFKYLASIQEEETTLQQFLEMMVATGSLTDVVFDGLQPSTEYVLYAYGVTTDGRRTTDIVSEVFTTEDPYEGDITFTFDVKENDYVLNYTITPSHTGVPYYFGIVPESEMNEWKALYGDDVRTAIQKGDIDPSVAELIKYGMISDASGYFDVFTESDVMDYGYCELTASTKYILFAAKWNEDCQLVGPVSTYEHTSAAVEQSENVLTLAVENITQSSADAVVTATTDDPYAIIPVKAEDVQGLTDEEIFAYLVGKYDYILSEYTFNGDKTRTYSRMRPDTDYIMFAFGYKAGTMTTSQLYKVEFKTLPAGAPEDCTFEFEIEPDVDNAWVQITPSDKGQYYHWFVYPSYYTAEDVKNFVTMYIEQAYEGDKLAFASWELSLGTDSATAWDLYSETEYKVGVIIMDYDTCEFLSDVIFSEPFTTPAKVYANIKFNFEYGAFYDLGELINAGMTQFEPLLQDGNAIFPIELEVEGECSAFYYDIYANDLSDTETYTDETFYAALEGAGCPKESSMFVVKYDKAMTLCAVAYDYENNPTVIYRDVLWFSQDEASPASEFIDKIQKSSATKSVSPFEFKPASWMPSTAKEYDGIRISEVDLQQRHEAAMQNVEDLRRQKLEEEMEAAKIHKMKFIAK